MPKYHNYSKALHHKIFRVISEAAEDLSVDAYVIGGFVRDHILERGDPKDIDIVAIGSGIELAKKVSEKLPNNPKVQIFKNFGTAMSVLKIWRSNLLVPEKKVIARIAENQ